MKIVRALVNILAEPLEQLAPTLAGLVVAGGCIVLSGLLAGQLQRVADRYEPWFKLHPAAVRQEWARLDGVRRFA